MQSKTFSYDGIVVTLDLDDASSSGYGQSSVSLRFPDESLPEGHIETIPVPTVRDGIPSSSGTEPTMEDLQKIAVLRIEFLPILEAVVKDGGEDRLAEVARSVGHEPPKSDGTFEWLLIIREAVEKGCVSLDGALASPGPRH